MERKFYIVDEQDAGTRLDVFLSKKTGKTRSAIGQLITRGNALVNGTPRKAGYRLKAGENVIIELPEEPRTDALIPEPIPLEVLYRDQDIIVLNKPAGLVMYPAAGHPVGTLMNGIAHLTDRLATVGGPLRPGVVHRLDKDTSGVVVVALSDRAYYPLVEQFKERTIEREYLVLVHGEMKEKSGNIAMAIGRARHDRKKMSTRTNRPREAVTHWEVIEGFGAATLLRAKLATGRTHQIRVHFSATGHPVLGDRTYGRKTALKLGSGTLRIPRQMLHAHILGIRHPVTNRELRFSVPMPDDMKRVVDALKRTIKGESR
ncbi:MAG: RluA family pseudouridine synthase [Nitrospirae bacterium]|nr:MAG: RluA family pseudouridine synthase [Nitrospirota bacterium]